jgi:hypothetical protein
MPSRHSQLSRFWSRKLNPVLIGLQFPAQIVTTRYHRLPSKRSRLRQKGGLTCLKAIKTIWASSTFCGHGASLGQRAALLLEDFGDPGAAYDAGIDVNVLRATMKNSTAVRQAYLLDCCRTKADDLYQHAESIGSRIVSIPTLQRRHTDPAQQFVLFPTIDGEEAFGIQNEVSVFTRSIIDAMDFAAADDSTGVWRTTTGRLLDSVDRLVKIRVPEKLINRSKPNALDTVSFDFNDVAVPRVARSYVTISDLKFWGRVEFECVDPSGSEPSQKKHSKHSSPESCCPFSLAEGGLNWSMQHWLGVYSQEFQSPRFCVGVD